MCNNATGWFRQVFHKVWRVPSSLCEFRLDDAIFGLGGAIFGLVKRFSAKWGDFQSDEANFVGEASFSKAGQISIWLTKFH